VREWGGEGDVRARLYSACPWQPRASCRGGLYEPAEPRLAPRHPDPGPPRLDPSLAPPGRHIVHAFTPDWVDSWQVRGGRCPLPGPGGWRGRRRAVSHQWRACVLWRSCGSLGAAPTKVPPARLLQVTPPSCHARPAHTRLQRTPPSAPGPAPCPRPRRTCLQQSTRLRRSAWQTRCACGWRRSSRGCAAPSSSARRGGSPGSLGGGGQSRQSREGSGSRRSLGRGRETSPRVI
jgi:hypothetical protein